RSAFDAFRPVNGADAHDLSHRELRKCEPFAGHLDNQRGDNRKRQRNFDGKADTAASIRGQITVPPICSILLRTTSIPTPRPEMLVPSSAVENPGVKMMLLISASDFAAMSTSLTRPASTALVLIRAASRPRPSSEISITM